MFCFRMRMMKSVAELSRGSLDIMDVYSLQIGLPGVEESQS